MSDWLEIVISHLSLNNGQWNLFHSEYIKTEMFLVKSYIKFDFATQWMDNKVLQTSGKC